jgi:maltokinase
MSAEQSNTSIAYGDEALLKLFRRVEPGSNPDIDVHHALTRHEGDFVAPLLGWLEGSWHDVDGKPQTGHLGMLQVFLRTATDGWDLALASVRNLLLDEGQHADEVGGDFAAEAERLGATTAGAHAALYDMFDTGSLDKESLTALGEAMLGRLDQAIPVVPELVELADGLRAIYAGLGGIEREVAIQRVHGDLHLGQTLRTVKGWKIIDFEGEPAKPLSERTALDSPARDVAGMLRSFDYAAAVTLEQFPHEDHEGIVGQADEWAERNRTAFLQGYFEVAATELHAALLRAYEADKAVYEAVYETRNRPSWLPIPLGALRRLAGQET